MNSIGQVGLTFMLTALGLALIGAIFTGKITVSENGVQIGDRGIVDISPAAFPITTSSTLDADQVSVGIGVTACANNEVWKGNGTGMECGTVTGGGGSGGSLSVREDTVQATSSASGLDFRPGFDVHHTDGNDSIVTIDFAEFSTTEATLESVLTDVSDVFTDNDTDFIDEDDLATSDWGHVRIFGGFAIVEDVTTSAIGQITDLGSGIRSGADGDLITGTAGGNGTCAEWNADGDLVEAASGLACGAGSGGGGGGGVSGSWWFMDAATGTTPVPDTASDTLAIVSPSSTIVITGDASADSVGFDVQVDSINSEHLQDDDLGDVSITGGVATVEGASVNTFAFGDGSSGDINLSFNGDGGADGLILWDVSDDEFQIDLDVNLESSLGDTPHLNFTPASGTAFNIGVEDSDDDLEIMANTASTERLEISNAGAGTIDVDIDGNLTAANVLTAKPYGFTIISPELGTTILPAWFASGATILEINCIVDPTDDAGDTVEIYLEERDSTADNPAGLDGTTTITCDGDGAADDGTLSNPSIDQNDYWSVVVTSTSGTISNLTVTGTFNIASGGWIILLALLAFGYGARRRGARA